MEINEVAVNLVGQAMLKCYGKREKWWSMSIILKKLAFRSVVGVRVCLQSYQKDGLHDKQQHNISTLIRLFDWVPVVSLLHKKIIPFLLGHHFLDCIISALRSV